ncbi:MAG: PAP2 family protein [Bacteroidetes bacterium SW_9_63_38]|nr:MAG: PAP2 family protein [Bacteroidetes bacterium SW_9_63_38]
MNGGEPPITVWRVIGVVRRVLIVFVLTLGFGAPSGAQPSPEHTSFCRESSRRIATVDTRGLGALYCTTNDGLAGTLHGIHRSARPVFYGAVPLAWGAAGFRGEGYAGAYQLTVAQGATYGLVLGLKHLVGRPRPFVTRALVSRSSHYGASQGERYQSFPSGHAALSAAIVTSVGLTYPRWYVLGPGTVWATGVSLSRLYLGVHYPSDVLVGAALGVGMAILVHQMRHAVTPSRLAGGEGRGVGLRIQF